METSEYIAVITGIATIVSVCINIVQWMRRAELIKALKSRSQATYNYFFQIARRSDSIRILEKSNDPPDKDLQKAISQAWCITGTANAARNDIISYSREHLKFLPQEEHPAHPILTPLPKPGKGGIGNSRQTVIGDRDSAPGNSSQ